ncbi:hypothetical protein [Nitrosopumilus adriaticus]|uniref:hypothetical protein n=1 Tax=Nitrosopumilus adriaticus TaxID=1580092 RepID=UPI0011DC7A4C|nr:hypothetical protein [Nitrosopumilus adriaticus]
MATATLLPSNEVAFSNNEITLDDTQNLDLSSNVASVTSFESSIGDTTTTLTKQVQLVTSQAGGKITLKNSVLPTVTVSLPDRIKISGPATWDNIITPPRQISTSGTVPSGFQTPTVSIQVGSQDVVLVFDTSVTILLTGTTGQTAYKLPGQNTWALISTCLGTYENPTDPPLNGECSVSNGVDTKIATFHFTEFTALSTISATTSSPATTTTSSGTASSSGGGGRTGVGSSGGSGSSSSAGFAGRLLPEGESQIRVFPNWFQTSLVTYWIEDSITDDEFKNAINYLLNKNIIKINVPSEQNVQLLDLAPSIKNLFKLWTMDKLTDSAIIKIITYYRAVGVW